MAINLSWVNSNYGAIAQIAATRLSTDEKSVIRFLPFNTSLDSWSIPRMAWARSCDVKTMISSFLRRKLISREWVLLYGFDESYWFCEEKKVVFRLSGFDRDLVSVWGLRAIVYMSVDIMLTFSHPIHNVDKMLWLYSWARVAANEIILSAADHQLLRYCNNCDTQLTGRNFISVKKINILVFF